MSASNTHSGVTYSPVTQAVWDCVQTTSTQKDGTVYNYTSSDHSQGTATTKGPWGHVDMRFNFDVATSQLTYTITSKSRDVPDSKIFDGIASTISGCQNQ